MYIRGNLDYQEDKMVYYCAPYEVVPCFDEFNLDCIVKSVDDAKRIKAIIDNTNEEFNNKGFYCNYVDNRPKNIKVRIYGSEKQKLTFLYNLIKKTNHISSKIVRQALEMEYNFSNYMKFEIERDALNYSYIIEDFMLKPGEIPQSKYPYVLYNNNLDQFEVWGIYNQIIVELKKGNTPKAVMLAKHIIQMYNNVLYRKLESKIKSGYDVNVVQDRKKLHKKFVEAVNIYNKSTKQNDEKVDGKIDTTADMDSGYDNLTDEMKLEFEKDWNEVVLKISEIVNLDMIIVSFKALQGKLPALRESIETILMAYSNIYIQFSLYGLYMQVSKNIRDDNYEYALMAIQHVGDQDYLNFLDKENELEALKIEAIYSRLRNIANKYSKNQKEMGTTRELKHN